jgi:thymidine kinase
MNQNFIVYAGPMFSAKTTSLLSTLDRYKYQGKRIVIFKPKLDDRYSVDNVSTHGGWKMPATCVKLGTDILENLANLEQNPHAIAVDEAFMIPGVADVLIWLYRSGYSIVVSSLDLSASGKPFVEIEKMLPWATKVEKLSAVCTVCNKDAFYTYKKQVGGDEIEIGGVELYEPRCSRCHPMILNQDSMFSSKKD